MGQPDTRKLKYLCPLLSVTSFLLLSGCGATGSTSSSYEPECSLADEVFQIKRGAESGEADAQFSLASWYYSGDCLERDVSKAMDWYHRSAEQNHSDAKYRLAGIYFHGLGVPKNIEKGLDWYRQTAEQGNFVASRTLGDIYRWGKYVPKDLDEAEKWYRLAVEQGDRYSQVGLDRTTMEKDPIAWALKEQTLAAAEEEALAAAVEEERAAAQERKVVRRKEKRSEFIRLTEAAKLGDAVAQYKLGEIYSLSASDYPTTPNLNTASTWFHKSADKGYSKAQFSLGYMYETGMGGNEKDISRAKDLYKKAADQGNISAKWRLCALYAGYHPRDKFAIGCPQEDPQGIQNLLPCLLLPFLCM